MGRNPERIRSIICGVALTAATSQAADPPTQPTADLQTWALEVSGADIDANCRFYARAFGFKIERADSAGAVLRLGETRLILAHGENPPPDAKPGIYYNLMVKDLAAAAKRTQGAGGSVDDPTPHPFALGEMIVARDPAGNYLHLLHIPEAMDDHAADTAVFNVGVIVSDLDEAERFYSRLGFEVYSRRWLPETLPLVRHGVFSLVLHDREDAQLRLHDTALILATPDLETARRQLPTDDKITERTGKQPVGDRPTLAFTDPAGNLIKLIAEPDQAVAMEPSH